MELTAKQVAENYRIAAEYFADLAEGRKPKEMEMYDEKNGYTITASPKFGALHAMIYRIKHQAEPQKCPVCKSEAILSRMHDRFYIECTKAKCNLVGPFRDTPEEAVAVWDRIRLEGEG